MESIVTAQSICVRVRAHVDVARPLRFGLATTNYVSSLDKGAHPTTQYSEYLQNFTNEKHICFNYIFYMWILINFTFLLDVNDIQVIKNSVLSRDLKSSFVNRFWARPIHLKIGIDTMWVCKLIGSYMVIPLGYGVYLFDMHKLMGNLDLDTNII